MRAYNERLVLTLIRSFRQLPKAEIARMTGLSPQTVSVIVRQLEADQLLLKGTALKGKVGQPLQPFLLNPEGAYAIGIKVGRRSSNVLCLDFSGHPKARQTEVYAYPDPEQVIAAAKAGLQDVAKGLNAAQRRKIAGIGIATPFEMWNWSQEVGAPEGVLERWRGVDVAAEIQVESDWPVLLCNDATAACAAELTFGAGRTFRNHAYFYIGFFVGGGVTLAGSLYQGTRGYAGNMASILVPGKSGSEQLLRQASLYVLENALKAKGHDPLQLTLNPNDWSQFEFVLADWIDQAGRALAHAAIAAAALIDLDGVIIDGALPPTVRARLVEAVKTHYLRLDNRGLASFSIVEGTIGLDARAMGGAALSLINAFGADRDVLLKDRAAPA
jgi:predicted NBD/HSP70 family sugar kinase